MDISNYLDIWDVWVNELIGDVWIFLFLGIAFIVYISLKGKLSKEATLVFVMLFLISLFTKNQSLMVVWAFVVLGVGFLFYFKMQKIVRQG